jgi:hypothetical protein
VDVEPRRHEHTTCGLACDYTYSVIRFTGTQVRNARFNRKDSLYGLRRKKKGKSLKSHTVAGDRGGGRGGEGPAGVGEGGGGEVIGDGLVGAAAVAEAVQPHREDAAARLPALRGGGLLHPGRRRLGRQGKSLATARGRRWRDGVNYSSRRFPETTPIV